MEGQSGICRTLWQELQPLALATRSGITPSCRKRHRHEAGSLADRPGHATCPGQGRGRLHEDPTLKAQHAVKPY